MMEKYYFPPNLNIFSNIVPKDFPIFVAAAMIIPIIAKPTKTSILVRIYAARLIKASAVELRMLKSIVVKFFHLTLTLLRLITLYTFLFPLRFKLGLLMLIFS